VRDAGSHWIERDPHEESFAANFRLRTLRRSRVFMNALLFCRIASISMLTAALAAADVTVRSDNYVIIAPNAAVAATRQAELEWSARVFETLMGIRPPRGRVTLSDKPSGAFVAESGEAAALVNTVPLTRQPPAPDGTVWNISWFASDRMGRTAKGRAFTALTHEAAHMQLLFAVNFRSSESLKAAYNGYGSFLPDWLDEAVAVYHEPEGLKAERRKRFNPAMRIPLREFFTMNHPGTPKAPHRVRIAARTAEEARRKLAEYTASQNDSLRKTTQELTRERGSVDAFYCQALAVIEYLTARGGLPFFRYAVVMQNGGLRMDEILRDWRAKQREVSALQPGIQRGAAPANLGGVLVRPGEAVNQMPPTLELLDADFETWIAKNYPKYRPDIPKFPGK
jgi:hypothetical protein